MKLTTSVIEFKLYLIAYAKKFREIMKEKVIMEMVNGKIPNWEILSLIWCNSHAMWLSSLCEGKHVVSETERAKREGNSNNKAGIRNRIGNWIRWWWTAILYFWELQKLRAPLVNLCRPWLTHWIYYWPLSHAISGSFPRR